MRYWPLSLVVVILLVTVGNTQDTKKKPKEPEKGAKDLPTTTITEIAGKSFKQWAEDIKSTDPTKREVAMKTLLNFHPEKTYDVAPEILKQLQRHNPPKGRVDLSVRVNAVIVLGTVFQYKKDPDAKLVKDTVTTFRAAIKDPQTILKIRTLQALPYLGVPAREAIPEVIDAINDLTTYETREEAIQTLANLVQFDSKAGLGANQANAMKALYGALEDSSYLVRFAALRALVPIGHSVGGSERAVILQKVGTLLAKETDCTVAIQAHVTMINLNRKAYLEPLTANLIKDHLQPIAKLTTNSDPTCRLNALEALGRLGPPGQPAQQYVTAALSDPDPNLALVAMATLVHMHAFGAIPELKRIKDDPKANSQLKEAAEFAIDQLLYIQKKLLEDKKKPDKK